MTELLYFAIIALSLCLVTFAARLGYQYLMTCSVLLGITTAVVAGKIIDVFGYEVSAATCLFAAIFLLTDVTSEVHGRKMAHRVVYTTFTANLVFLAIGYSIAALTPSQETPVSSALTGIFDFLPRLMFAGLFAFFVSQWLDIYIFEWVKKRTGEGLLWLRNTASTAISQFVDTVLLWHIAFFGIIPDLWPIILANYAVKLIVAVLDTPFCYIAVKLSQKR